MRSRLEPCSAQNWVGSGSDGANQVGTAHGRFRAFACGYRKRWSRMTRGELLRIRKRSAPDAHPLQAANARDCAQMLQCLDTRTEQREIVCVFAGKEPGDQSAHGSG